MWLSKFSTSLVIITNLYGQPAEVIRNHDRENVRRVGQGEAQRRKYKRLKQGGRQSHDRSKV